MEKVAVNSGYWQGKRVFLTGHTGFKGGWLALWLQAMGAKVHGYSLGPPTEPNLFSVARIGDGMSASIVADIRDADSFTRAMQAAQPEIVFHLAAQPLVRRSYADPVETYATNVIGTVNLFEAVRATPNIRAVVNITTDKCYENREWLWGYRENEPMGGHDPYSSSKACAELVTSAYRRSYFDAAGVAVASARAGNVIGGGDWAADRLVPDTLRAFDECRPVQIRYPSAIRPWQHVLEPLRGYLLLAEHLVSGDKTYAEGWNFGPDDSDARSVEWIVSHLADVWGHGACWIRDEAEHPHEAAYLKLDISKARSRLGWNPHWNLEQALDQTVSWYRAWQGGVDMRDFTLKQIAVHSGYQSSSRQ